MEAFMRRTNQSFVAGFLTLATLLVWSGVGYAQEATIGGTVRDATGKPIAAVQVAATHVASGQTVDTVTDANGGYRIPVLVGSYVIKFSAAGFATVNRTGVELLLGQQGIVNVQMTVSTEARTITVTGEVEIANAGGSTNFDVRRTEDTPLNGRDVNTLAQGAVGNTQRQQNELPVDTGTGTFQTNYDGQRVTQNLAGGFGQTRYSRDALGQIEFVQNRFDASSGQAGMQQNAVTKSGANRPAGTFSGFFRSDKFDAGDFTTVNTAVPGCASATYPLPKDCRKVLPYSDQQFAATYGGPIIKDRFHYFANFEYERNPHDLTYNTGYKTFDAVDQLSILTQKIGMLRLDYVISPKTRLAVRGNESTYLDPVDARYGGGNNRAPSTPLETHRHSDDALVILTQVLSPRMLNQVNAGYSSFYWWQDPIMSWSGGCGYVACQPYPALQNGSMIVSFPGLTIGQSHTNSYQRLEQDTTSITDNFNFSYNAKGAHNLKIGGNYLHIQDPVFICNNCMGQLKFSGNPSGPLAIIPGVGNLATPTDGSLESLFPQGSLNQALWNLAPLSPWVQTYTVGLGQMQVYAPMNIAGMFVQDDWKMDRLTLNLGLRYDYEAGVWAEDFDAAANGLGKWLQNNRNSYSKAFAPRTGFAYKLNEKSTIRGGWGLYWVDPGSNTAFWTHIWGQGTTFVINNPNLGKASNFAADPFGCLANPSACTRTPAGGFAPTLAQAAANLCTTMNITSITDINNSGCFRRTATNLASNDLRLPYNYQSSIGLSQQLTRNSAFGVDFVFSQDRQGITSPNQNLAYDPVRGINYAFNDLAHLPDPQFQQISGKNQNAEANTYGVQGSFTKRQANRFSIGATYLWQKKLTHDVYPVPYNQPELFGSACSDPVTFTAGSGLSCNVPITLQPYIADNTWWAAPIVQKITFNGSYQAPWGLTLSANYLWGNHSCAAGSPTCATPTYSADPTLTSNSGSYRLVPVGRAPVSSALAMGFQPCTAANAVDPIGCLIPRNSLLPPDISKLDVRLTKAINTGTRVKLNAILEVFNVLNRINYLSYGTVLSTAATFGLPTSSTNVTYYPRMAQLAFRATF
jgi:hypothetical protein